MEKLNKFEERVMREGIVDTRKYRYRLKDTISHAEIQRLPLKDLNTTAAIDGWETVKIIR